MKQISSRDNPLFKSLKKLVDSSSASRASAQAVLEGVHLCKEYTRRMGAPRTCVVTRSALDVPEVGAIVETLDLREILVFEEPLFRSISQIRHGVGILFLIDLPKPPVLDHLEETCILLDRLQDPGNLGSILRSAAAAGIRMVCCSSQTVSAWSPKVLRAGMGAHFHLDIFEECDLGSLVAGSRVAVIASSSHAGRTLYELDLRRHTAWIFGNEGAGISPEISRISETVAIPQAAGIESLNVAAAAAVCLFEQVRQRVPSS